MEGKKTHFYTSTPKGKEIRYATLCVGLNTDKAKDVLL